MVYDDFRDGGAPEHDAYASRPAGTGASRWMNLAGAATSVALILGVVIWGYKLAVRDVTGVPVIRGMQGPMRIAPEDPGGELARHTGLSVNTIAGTGLAAPGPDRVVLAPGDAALSEEDVAMGDLAARPEGAGTEFSADALTGAQSPALPGARPDDVTASAALQIIPETVPGVKRSPRPLAKPQGDLIAEAAAAAVARALAGDEEDVTPVDLDPAQIAPGTRLVQLGAFDGAAEARTEWDKVASRFAALMEGKRRVIQSASSGGRAFYRLRVEGFENVADARRFCAALQAEGQNCIPALVR